MPGTEPYGLAKLKGILLGDDNWGTVLDEDPPYKNVRGIEMIRYLIVPGEHLMKQYPRLQKPGALTHKGIALWVEYPTYYVSDKNPSRTNAIVRVDCGFDGRDTAQTQRHKKLQKEIEMLREELETAQLNNIVQAEENRKLQGEILEHAQKVAEFSQIMKGGSGGSTEEKNPYEQDKD